MLSMPGGVDSPCLPWLILNLRMESKLNIIVDPLSFYSKSMPSMPGGDDKKEDDKAPETPEAKAEREQQVKNYL